MPAVRKRSIFFFALFISLCCAIPSRAQESKIGKWDPVFPWPNVAIHINLLPTGKILFWSRREGENMAERDCVPRLWDPASGGFNELRMPGWNLFCAGQAFLPDGRLFVAGGHIYDGFGEPHATIFDPADNSWHRTPDMNRGRWYPTVIELADGAMLVCSGSDESSQVNDVTQVFQDNKWRSLPSFDGLPLYPRLHVLPDNRVFMTGYRTDTYFLNTDGAGSWTRGPDHVAGTTIRDYGASVQYSPGKILVAGGGIPPQSSAEVIDTNDKQPAWRAIAPMAFARRHFNSTLLPDGTILMTGGTSGAGGGHPFNDVTAPVFTSELWEPKSEKFTQMASESVARLYHSSAILLPDGRVLSTGGGEYTLPTWQTNPPKDTHKDGQLFSPPYLFKGPRPTIQSMPTSGKYGEAIPIVAGIDEAIARVTMLPIGATTHSFNQNQCFNELKFAANGKQIKATLPGKPQLAPPGYYLLFLISERGVPSIGSMIRIS